MNNKKNWYYNKYLPETDNRGIRIMKHKSTRPIEENINGRCFRNSFRCGFCLFFFIIQAAPMFNVEGNRTVTPIVLRMCS